MNMSKKRSPRKKRFEFCHRPTLEWWIIPSILVTIIILTESNAAGLAFQNNTENLENSVRDIAKLQQEHKKEMPTINEFNDTTINYTALPENKTHDNVMSGIIGNAESNLVRFPAIITTTKNSIGDKMAASEHIIKDKHSTDNIANDSIVMFEDDISSVGYIQLNNVTNMNENSTNNVENLRNTTQIVKKETFSTAAISVPCLYKMLGSNTQNCDNIFNISATNSNNTSETAKHHQKRLIDDLNSEDFVMNDIDFVKNGVKVDFNYNKDGGIDVNVAQKNSEVLNMNVHKSSTEGQENNVNNMVKGQDKSNVKSSLHNSVGPNNSAIDSGNKNNGINNSSQNFGSNNNSLNNSVRLRTNVYLYGGWNSYVKNFEASSDGQNKRVDDFGSSSGEQNSSVNDFVTSFSGQNKSINNFVSSSGSHNISVNDFVMSSAGRNINVNNSVSSFDTHNIIVNDFISSSGGQNNSVNNSVGNFGSQNYSANNVLNNTAVDGRTNVHLYGGHKSSVKNFGASFGRRNTSVDDSIASSDGQNSSVNIFTSSGGHNIKSVVMKNPRVRNFQTRKNKTHVKAGEGYVLLEDERDEYEASRNHDLDEYDRTTIRTKSVCKLCS